jgi:hypothetical protein
MKNGMASLGGRSRRRWMVVAGVMVFWLFLWVMTGSFAAAIVIMVVLTLVVVVIVVGLRTLGITRDHPFFKRIAARPWRNGRDVLNLALGSLSEVLVMTPSGSLYAPDSVELAMNPRDLASLHQWMDFDVLSASASEAYGTYVAEHGARFAGPCQPEVYIVPDASLPQGRYRLRRGVPASARHTPDTQHLPDPAERQFAYSAEDQTATQVDPARVAPVAKQAVARTRADIRPGQTVMDGAVMEGAATVMEQTRPVVPKLRLVTGSAVAQTSWSGARAGRGAVELKLPDVPTVSRVHATFTFSAGRWWVTSKGANGLCVNGTPIAGKHPLSDGDTIRWGKLGDAPQSKVEIG